ncbi:amidohydrolase [Romboutsia sp.]|uniref:amidohydrolase n=1 Tax=Romboutsia sp. TaxID=1965302 RepID=UPI003F371C8C
MTKTLYKNGTILTMAQEESAEAVLVENGKIAYVGSIEKAETLVDENTEIKDLQGNTLLPGFIDPHSHFFYYVPAFGYRNLSPSPIGKVNTIEDLKNEMREHIKVNNIPKGGWVIGMGYDTAGFEDQRHPNKFDLDDISDEHYIIVAHASNHLGAINSKVLEHLKIDENSKDPQGGLYGRVEGTNEPNGYMEETAFMTEIMALFPKLGTDELMENVLKLQEYYASFGITTTQDGMLDQARMDIAIEAEKRDLLKLDFVLYPGKPEVENNMLDNYTISKDYDGKHYRLGGVKLFLDGSPQGRTAWLTEAYEDINNGQGSDYKGYPIFSDEVVYDYLKYSIENGYQVLTHVNGDAAIDQLLNMYDKARKDLNFKEDLRPVAIHSQITRDEQIDRYKELGMIPSYFVDHTFFWGDTHIQNLGERAQRISPLKTTKEKGVRFTLHQDTPVIPPNMIRTINSAVSRATKNGVNLTDEEKITVYDALKAITIDGAYQYHEEDRKGSIEVGKLADFVILDKNPLSISNDEILDIQVLETIKEDMVVFSK